MDQAGIENVTMKIVFVHPRVGFKGGHSWEAMGIGYLVSYLKQHLGPGLETEFYSGFYDSDEEIIGACEDASIVGFSCTSPQFKHGLDLARRVKTRHNRIVFGGIHASALSHDLLREECIDAVVVGEGERAMLEIARNVANDADIAKRAYRGAPFENLDEIPFPDRKAIKNERNIQQTVHDEGIKITSVLSSRGCPYQCSFCCSHTLWGRRIRFRSAANTLAEVEQLVKDWGIEFLKFADDTFTANKQRVIEFCDLKMARGVKIPFGANAHVNTIDENVLDHLARSGCQEMWFGVESGSPRILADIHKHTDIPRMKEAFRLAKKHGMRTRAYFILGMPNETLEDIALTERLCDELQPDMVGFTLLSPFPDNEHFDYATMKDWDWSTFDEYGNQWVRTKTLSNQSLRDIQKRLVEKYQSRIAFRQRERKGQGVNA